MASIPREKNPEVLRQYNDELARINPPYDENEERKILRRRSIDAFFAVDEEEKKAQKALRDRALDAFFGR